MYSVSQDEEFRTMIRAGERMEFWYGHWFDCTVVNEDLDHAFEEVNYSSNFQADVSGCSFYWTMELSSFLMLTNGNHYYNVFQVAKAIRRLDQDAQWVPASWVQ